MLLLSPIITFYLLFLLTLTIILNKNPSLQNLKEKLFSKLFVYCSCVTILPMLIQRM